MALSNHKRGLKHCNSAWTQFYQPLGVKCKCTAGSAFGVKGSIVLKCISAHTTRNYVKLIWHMHAKKTQIYLLKSCSKNVDPCFLRSGRIHNLNS